MWSIYTEKLLLQICNAYIVLGNVVFHLEVMTKLYYHYYYYRGGAVTTLKTLVIIKGEIQWKLCSDIMYGQKYVTIVPIWACCIYYSTPTIDVFMELGPFCGTLPPKFSTRVWTVSVEICDPISQKIICHVRHWCWGKGSLHYNPKVSNGMEVRNPWRALELLLELHSHAKTGKAFTKM